MSNLHSCINVLVCSFALLASVWLPPAHAQSSPYTPSKGSAERKALMDALRVPVEKELKQKVVFVASNLKCQNGWGFFSGKAQRPNGSPVDYSRTAYAEQIEMDMFEDNLFAVLKKNGDSWKVVEYAIGCTDVCYEEWSAKHRAPIRIFN
jgi:hypothetical protein